MQKGTVLYFIEVLIIFGLIDRSLHYFSFLRGTIRDSMLRNQKGQINILLSSIISTHSHSSQ